MNLLDYIYTQHLSRVVIKMKDGEDPKIEGDAANRTFMEKEARNSDLGCK